MKRISIRRAAMFGVAASLGCLVDGSQVQAAGLLDFLFGGFQQQRPAVRTEVYEPAPLAMRVRPRRARSEPAREAKPKLATPIDTKTHPEWYLEDKTLRRGDIVVLKNRVLVFDGGRGGSLADFTALDQSRLGKSERTRISQMTGLQYVSVTTVAELPAAAPAKAKRVRSAKRSRSRFATRMRPAPPQQQAAAGFFD